jgi:hypothetical protein
MPDDEMERTELIGKVLPDIRALREHMKKVGLDITLTVKTVNSVPGRPRRRSVVGDAPAFAGAEYAARRAAEINAPAK